MRKKEFRDANQRTVVNQIKNMGKYRSIIDVTE